MNALSADFFDLVFKVPGIKALQHQRPVAATYQIGRQRVYAEASGEGEIGSKRGLRFAVILFCKRTLVDPDSANDVYSARDEALRKLRKMTAVGRSIYSDDAIKKEFISLCKDLPAQIPLEYGRKEMKPYQKRIDKLTTMLFLRNREALKADVARLIWVK